MGTVTALRKIFRKREDKPASSHRDPLASCNQEQVARILYYSEAETIIKALPDLTNKKILLVRNPSHQYLSQKCTQAKVLTINDAVFSCHPRQALADNREASTLLCDRDKLPIKKAWADVTIVTLAMENHVECKTNIAEAARVTKNGGRLIISFCHPQFEKYTQKKDLLAKENTESSIMNYFQELKRQHLFTEDLLEGRIDLSLKACFIDENLKDNYPSVKNHPVSLIFRAVKFVREK